MDEAADAQEAGGFDAEKFIFDVPLYERKTLKDLRDLDPIFRKTDIRFNGLCFFCGRQSVLSVMWDYSSLVHNEFGTVVRRDKYLGNNSVGVLCARSAEHILHMQLLVDEEEDNAKKKTVTIQKVGQYPSHADISGFKVKEYSSVLNKLDRVEIVRAVGIAAHGVNIGAFVYLRRVFERLIERHYEQSNEVVPRDEYLRLRMSERIAALKDYLPPFVVENNVIYGILSKGIHELSEDECGRYYEILLESILLILDQEKTQADAKKKQEAIKKALSRISGGS